MSLQIQARPLQAPHAIHAPTTQPRPGVHSAGSESTQASSLAADIVEARSFKTSLQPVLLPGLSAAGAGLATGALMGGGLLPVSVGKGAALGGGFGAAAGLAAGVGSGLLVNKYIDNRLGATAAGAGVGALSGAVAGLAMAVATRGNLWMNAGFMAVPGLVAGAVGGFAAAQAKHAAQ